MRALSRFGAAVAATALASATVLAGAGVAVADDSAPATPKPVVNSPSTVSAAGKGATTKVTYTNNSAHDLGCAAIAGPGGLLSELHAVMTDPKYTDETMPKELQDKFSKAAKDGKLGGFSGLVEKGKAAELTAGELDTSIPGGDDLEFKLTNDSFAPAALAFCYGETGYQEVELSAGAGVPAGLGSLDMALTGIGSSGSVANTAGSLGS